jgi:hypothetical protein
MKSIHVCQRGHRPSPEQVLQPKEGSVYGIMTPFNPLVARCFYRDRGRSYAWGDSPQDASPVRADGDVGRATAHRD